MSRFFRILVAVFAISLFCAVSAFAADDAADAAASFDVNIIVNGNEYGAAEVTASVEGNVYTFELRELFDLLGVDVSYDEDTDTAVLSARPDSLAAVLFTTLEASGEPTGEASDEPSGEMSGEPSGEPSGEASEEPSGEPVGEPSGEITEELSDEPSGEASEEPSGEPADEVTAAHIRRVEASEMVKRRDILSYWN